MIWYWDKPSSHCPCVTTVVVPDGHRVQTWRHRGCIPGQCKLEALTLYWYHSQQYSSGVILPGLPDHGWSSTDHKPCMVMSLWTYRARSSNAEKIIHALNMLRLVCMLPTTFLLEFSMHLHVQVKSNHMIYLSMCTSCIFKILLRQSKKGCFHYPTLVDDFTTTCRIINNYWHYFFLSVYDITSRKPLSHQMVMPQRLYSIKNVSARSGIASNLPKKIFAS